MFLSSLMCTELSLCGRCVMAVMRLLFCTQATKEVNNMTVKMPHQCFINGKFEDAENDKSYDTINPTDGSVSDMIYSHMNPKQSLERIL